MTYSPLHSLGAGDSVRINRVGLDLIDHAAKPAWKIKISGKEFAGNTVFSDDLAVVLIEPHCIAGIRLADGEELWRIKDPACRKISWDSSEPEMRARDGRVLVMGENGYAEIDPKSGKRILFQSNNKWPDPPENLLWQFGSPDACLINGWEYCRGGWINRETEELLEIHPDASSLTDKELMKDFSCNTAGWIGARHGKHPDSDKSDELHSQARCADLKQGKLLWSRDFHYEKDYIRLGGRSLIAGDILVVGLEFAPNHPFSPRKSLFLDLATGEELWRLDEGFGDMTQTNLYWPSRAKCPSETDLEAGSALLIQQGETLETRNCHTGELIWTTKDLLKSKLPEVSRSGLNGVTPFARAGRILWVLHLFTEESSRKGKRGEPPKLIDKAELVSMDYVTGDVLHRQKVPRSIELLGQHGGSMLVRHGTTLTCYK